MEGHPCPAVIPRPPDVVVSGDSPARVMAHTPELLGVSLRRVLWRFGFQPGRLLAMATGVWTTSPVWVMAVYGGTVLDLYRGGWSDQPPAQFLNVMAARLEDDRREFGGLHPGPERLSAAAPEPGGAGSEDRAS